MGSCSSSSSLVLPDLEVVSFSASHQKSATSKAIHTLELSYLQLGQYVSQMSFLFFDPTAT